MTYTLAERRNLFFQYVKDTRGGRRSISTAVNEYELVFHSYQPSSTKKHVGLIVLSPECRVRPKALNVVALSLLYVSGFSVTDE